MKLKTMGAMALVLALCLWASRPAMAGPGMGGGMGGGRMGGGGMGGGDMGGGGMGGPGMGGPGMGGEERGRMSAPSAEDEDKGYERGHGHDKHHKYAGEEKETEEEAVHGRSHQKHKKHGKHAEAEEAETLEGPFFNARNKHALRSQYGKGLPPGLQKHLDRTGHLPPGLEMQLQRNGHLPPGLERGDLYPVSPKTARRFGAVPPNTKLYLYGRDAILLNEHTGAIVDILRNAY